MKYERAEELRQVLDELIRVHHPHLLLAKIGLLWREKAGKSKGRVTLASAAKFSLSLRPLFAEEDRPDFVITVAANTWKALDDAQKLAVLDHELSHCFGDEGEDGTTVWSIIGHDLEEFAAVVRRHGMYTDTHQAFRKAMDENRLDRL